MFSRSPNVLEKEKQLEEQGRIYELQKYRYETFCKDEKNSFLKRHKKKENIDALLREERECRELAQKAISLTGDITQDPERSEEITEEMRSVDKDFFESEQQAQRLRAGIAHGSIKRGMDLWRSNPQWYLHRTLLSDCAERGGCCGRSCGCCRNRKLRPAHSRAAGHCTDECKCCHETHGFKHTPETSKFMRSLYPLNPSHNPQYYRKIMVASILGLAEDSTESPFDLIDKPPEYKQSEPLEENLASE